MGRRDWHHITTAKQKHTHLSAIPEFSLCDLTAQDELFVQRQQLWVGQQDPLSQSKIGRCVLSRQNGRPSVAHDRGGARRRGSGRRKRSRRGGFRRGQRRSGRDGSFGRCGSRPGVRRRGQDAATAIATDDVGQLGLERFPLRIGHVLRHRRKGKVVPRIVVDEAELQSDLSRAFFAAEQRCGWVSGEHARGRCSAYRMRPGGARAPKGLFYRPGSIVDGCL